MGRSRQKLQIFGDPSPCAKVALAFGNKIVLTADYVSIETTCASALPTRSRSSWEPYDPCAKVAQGLQGRERKS